MPIQIEIISPEKVLVSREVDMAVLPGMEGDIAAMPDKLLERTDTRYASKETERSVQRLGWIVISAVVVAVLSIVIREF